jgi:uncharacterized protein (UPF0248 family)
VPTFAGIDLTSSPKKASAYASLGAGLRILSLDFLLTDSDIPLHRIARLTKRGETLIFNRAVIASY